MSVQRPEPGTPGGGDRGLPREGGCLCGAVRYRVAGPLADLCCCYCRSCRLAAGAPMVAWGTIGASRFEVLRGSLHERRSSARAVRGFCPDCGTSITYRADASPGEIDVSLATLDDGDDLRPHCHIWVAEKPAWMRIDDALPRFAGERTGS